jgi:hypothetical protein
LRLLIAVSAIASSVFPAPLAAEEFAQKRYACIIAGTPVLDAPGSAGRKLLDMGFGEEAAVGASREIREKGDAETWVRVKRGKTVGWTAAYCLAPQRPRREDYLEAPDPTLGTWTSYSGGHPIRFTLHPDGRCDIDGCPSVMGIPEAGEPVYEWREAEGNIAITAFGPGSGDEGEIAFDWTIRERTKFRLLVDERGAGTRELYRESLLVRAAAIGSLDYMRAVFANNRYEPADLDGHFTFDDYYDEARDPEIRARELRRRDRDEAIRQRDLDRKRREVESDPGDGFGGAGEGWGPPIDLYGDELLPPLPCDHPTGRQMISLPLLGIALSARRYREDIALFLIGRGADVNARMRKDEALEDEEPVDEPLLLFLKKHGAEKGCAFLLAHGADAEGRDAEGRTYAYLASGDNMRSVAPRGGLNLRRNPSQDGAVISVIPYGAEVLVLDESGGEETISGLTGRWTRVMRNRVVGWVFGGYLR